MKRPLSATLLIAGWCWAGAVHAQGFDFGVGLGFVDAQNSAAFEGGWDFTMGYEFAERDDWQFGGQLHLIQGWTAASELTDETSMAFRSYAAYLTARPSDLWLQVRAGLVDTDYTTLTETHRGTGLAVGLGIVLGSGNVRLHLFDVNHYMIDGRRFNTFSFSLLLLAAN